LEAFVYVHLYKHSVGDSRSRCILQNAKIDVTKNDVSVCWSAAGVRVPQLGLHPFPQGRIPGGTHGHHRVARWLLAAFFLYSRATIDSPQFSELCWVFASSSIIPSPSLPSLSHLHANVFYLGVTALPSALAISSRLCFFFAIRFHARATQHTISTRARRRQGRHHRRRRCGYQVHHRQGVSASTHVHKTCTPALSRCGCSMLLLKTHRNQ
jgi:hypothetical protein